MKESFTTDRQTCRFQGVQKCLIRARRKSSHLSIRPGKVWSEHGCVNVYRVSTAGTLFEAERRLESTVVHGQRKCLKIRCKQFLDLYALRIFNREQNAIEAVRAD